MNINLPRLEFLALFLAGATACVVGDTAGDEPGDAETSTGDDSSTGDPDPGPQLAACTLPPANPTRLAYTATDFSTGSLGYADIASRTLHNDLALVSSDPVPFAHGGRVYVVNRYGHDYLTVLDANSFALLGEYRLRPIQAGSANPHSIAFDPQGLAYVPLFGGPEVRVLDVTNPAAITEVASIDMTSVADADGNPELGRAIACGDYLWVSADRLDADWVPVDSTRLVAIDTTTRAVLAPADGINPGSITLQGQGMHNVRLDPRDPSGTTLLVLTSGLERVDLTTGAVSWVISDATFAAAGLSRLQLSTFDISDDGWIYLSASGEEWPSFEIWRAGLDNAGADLTKVVAGLQSSTGSMDVIGNQAWFLDSTEGASGVRIFDLSTTPASEVTPMPLSTGLPPYALVALP